MLTGSAGLESVIDVLRAVMAELPGYLVPRLVREVPGAPCKVPLEGIAVEMAEGTGELRTVLAR